MITLLSMDSYKRAFQIGDSANEPSLFAKTNT